MKKLIPQSLRGSDWTDESVDQKRYSCSTFMMYLGVRGEVPLPHHTIYISSKYRDNLDNISTHGRLSEDPSFYVCNPSRIDPTLAPSGRSSLYVLVPTPNTKCGIDWQKETPRLRREAIGQISRRLGIDLEDRIEVEHICTPGDWAGMNINFGATFNLAHNLGQMLHKRPQHRMPGVEGVWFVGGGTHPGSGLPVIFLSSQITAGLMCEEMGVAYSGARLQESTRAAPGVAAALESVHVG
jgi:phytoene desaturase